MSRTFATIPSDKVEVELDGLIFGDSFGDNAGALVQQQTEDIDVPQSLASLADILRSQSKLLGLEGDDGLTKSEVLFAYGADINLLDSRMRELDECVRQAIRCSIVFGGGDQLDPHKQELAAEEIWAQLQQQLPPIEYQHILKLPFTLAAQEPAAILIELQQQFQQILAQALRRLSLHMKKLVDEDRVGLVVWAGADACCYHYFCHEQRRSLKSEHIEKHDVKTRPGFGEIRTVRTRTVLKEGYIARHVHHVVNAKLHDLDEYKRSIPKRIRNFLDSVPPQVRHLFQIVDGQMTMEEVVARKISEKTEVESETIAVYEYDPAVTLGDYVLIGWDLQEVQAEQTHLWQERKRQAKQWLKVAAATLLGVTFAALVYLCILSLDNHFTANKKAAQQAVADAYTAHAKKFASDPVLQAKAGEVLELGQSIQIAYGGLDYYDNNSSKPADVVLLVGQRKTRYFLRRSVWIPESRTAVYGEADLDGAFGIQITLHILKASAESLEYQVKQHSAIPAEKP